MPHLAEPKHSQMNHRTHVEVRYATDLKLWQCTLSSTITSIGRRECWIAELLTHKLTNPGGVDRGKTAVTSENVARYNNEGPEYNRIARMDN